MDIEFLLSLTVIRRKTVLLVWTKKNRNEQYDKYFIKYINIILVLPYSKPRIQKCDVVRYHVLRYWVKIVQSIEP